MIRLPDDLAPRDVEVWLSRGVYLVESSDGELAPATYGGYEERQVLSRLVRRGASRQRHLVRTSRDRVLVHWPRGGCYNFRSPATGEVMYGVYVSRLARRQWCRTLRLDMISVRVPDRWNVRRRYPGVRTGLVTEELGGEMLVPEYPTLDEAREMLEQIPTVAISRRLVLTKSGGLYYNGDYVGRMDGGLFVCETDESLEPRINRLLDKSR